MYLLFNFKPNIVLPDRPTFFQQRHLCKSVQHLLSSFTLNTGIFDKSTQQYLFRLILNEKSNKNA